HRYWVSGQPEHDTVANLPERHRAPRLDGQLPHVALAELLDGADHVVLLAAAGTAGGQYDVEPLGCMSQVGKDPLLVVGPDTEVGGLAAGELGQSAQHRRVGIINLAQSQRPGARTNDLVARGYDGDTQAAEALDLAKA